MSIMKRVRDITIATLNDRLEHAQDPIRVIDGFLAEMANAIRQTEALYKQCAAHTASMRSQYLQAESLVGKREHQAMTALKAGEDGIARAALAEKVLEEEKRDGFSSLYEQSRLAMLELQEQLNALNKDYQEAYHKRQYYLARVETLRLQRQLNERSRHYTGNNSGVWFDRLEEQIRDIEYENSALRDVRGGASAAGQYGSGYGTDRIDQALQDLKKKLESEGIR
ncbi:PspA/IM30 family protein [Paenibacillus thermotolerans]|uniref:PspA/IM30 family protein n=1 Tax=Paenibacillus thermotolerans TaxID=3027807 RepID=UPI002367B5D8|nr:MULTISPECIES: PspA/IM30 family protein [unclassified Paenibacillus]